MLHKFFSIKNFDFKVLLHLTKIFENLILSTLSMNDNFFKILFDLKGYRRYFLFINYKQHIWSKIE